MDRRTLLTGIAGVGMAGVIALRPSPILAQGSGAGALAAPATGQVFNSTGTLIGNFVGTLSISQFAQQGSSIVAIGRILGNVVDLAGNVIRALSSAVTLITNITQSTCTILTLTLGPLDLNLLGLMVHLNQVVLTITASPSGGILGQLLCSLAGTTLLTQLVDLLNQLLDLFGPG
jgi:hypothetical protein